jgi:hypothetical protein
MDATCRVTKPGTRTWDEATLSFTTTAATVYEGPCEVKVPYRAPNAAYVPGQAETVQMGRLKLPVTTPAGATGSTAAVGDGMDVLILSCASDPGLVGAKFKARGAGHESNATARRFVLEAYT